MASFRTAFKFFACLMLLCAPVTNCRAWNCPPGEVVMPAPAGDPIPKCRPADSVLCSDGYHYCFAGQTCGPNHICHGGRPTGPMCGGLRCQPGTLCRRVGGTPLGCYDPRKSYLCGGAQCSYSLNYESSSPCGKCRGGR
jgi:hypothetical protein